MALTIVGLSGGTQRWTEVISLLFLAMLAAWIMGMAVSVGQFTTLVQTEIPEHVFANKFYTDIYGPNRTNPNDFADPMTLWHYHEVDVCVDVMSQQLLNVLP